MRESVLTLNTRTHCQKANQKPDDILTCYLNTNNITYKEEPVKEKQHKNV